jgi:hypothetical protein
VCFINSTVFHYRTRKVHSAKIPHTRIAASMKQSHTCSHVFGLAVRVCISLLGEGLSHTFCHNRHGSRHFCVPYIGSHIPLCDIGTGGADGRKGDTIVS